MLPFLNVASYPRFERKETGSFHRQNSKASSFIKNLEKGKVDPVHVMKE